MHRLLLNSRWSTFSFDYDPLLLWRCLPFTLLLTLSSVALESNLCAPEQIEASFPD